MSVDCHLSFPHFKKTLNYNGGDSFMMLTAEPSILFGFLIFSNNKWIN